MWRNRAVQFEGYVGKVFGLFDFLRQYKGFGTRPQIPAGMAVRTLLFRDMGPSGQLESKGEKLKVKEFYERGVAISYVGVQPRLQLGEERIPPGGSEKVTALRLIDELDQFHGWHRCDILCLDAGFVSGPFINAIRAGHKHVLVKVKQDEMPVVREANAEFAGRKPTVVLHNATCLTREEQAKNDTAQIPRYRYQVKIWDGDGFCLWRQVNEPMRLLRIEEVRQVRRGNIWEDEEPQVAYASVAQQSGRLALRQG